MLVLLDNMITKAVVSSLIFSAIVSIFVVSETLPNTSGENYYWRDYNGIVPLDAVQAGKDSNGKPFYIGQGYYDNVGLIPGTLYPGSVNLTITAAFKLYNAFKYVKILCSPNNFLFSWIPTTNEKFGSLSNKCHLVLGGTEVGKELYIGRTIHEGRLYAGKIFPYPPPELCLPITYNNYESRYKNYEVLTFNCLEQNMCFKDDRCLSPM